MIRGVIKKIGEIFLRDKGKKYIIVEGDKNLINPDYEISIDDLGGGSNNGEGGSSDGSKDEYTTDYPDDFIIKYTRGTSQAQLSLKEIKDKVESTAIGFHAEDLYIKIPNLIDESVQLIYDFPEATYKGAPFDPTKYYINPTGWVPAGIEPRLIALSVKKIQDMPVCIGGNVYLGDRYIPLTIKFKTKDNKSYKFTTRMLTSEYNSINPLIVSRNANYIHCEVKYLDIDSAY